MDRISIRVGDAVLHRLDALVEHGGFKNRSEAARMALLEATFTAQERDTPPTRDELLRLLGMAARGGSTTAAKMLLDEYGRDDPYAKRQPSKIDQLAARRRERRRHAQIDP
jgi:Arc/MetJ-type ribon-helix-helix transcriptional regulator